MARQATDVEILHYSTGAPWTARPGDWIITLGTELIEVVPPKEFPTKFAEVTDGLLIPRSLCGQIENTTGIGTTQSPAELVSAIERLAKIEIGGVKIEFTPGQLSELKHRASKRGYTIEQELQRTVDRIREEIFHHS